MNPAIEPLKEADPARAESAASWPAQLLAVRWGGPAPEPLSAAEWPAVQAEILAQRVIGQLYEPLRQYPECLPEDALHWVAAIHAVNQLRSDAWQNAARETLAAMATAGIDFLVLKGWWFIAKYFDGDFAQHPVNDLDLLVHPGEYEAACEVVAALGFRPTALAPWPGFKRRYLHEESFSCVLPQGRPFITELHWQLGFDLPGFHPLDEAALLLGAREVEILGVGCRVPTPEEHFVYCCGHLVLQHCDDRARLFRLYDLALMHRSSNPALCWQRVWRLANTWELVGCVQQCLAELQQVWPGLLSAELLETAAGQTIAPAEAARLAALRSGPPSPTYNRFRHIRALPGWCRQLRFLAEWLIPCPAYMRQRYELHGATPPLLAAYLQRWRDGLRTCRRRQGNIKNLPANHANQRE